MKTTTMTMLLMKTSTWTTIWTATTLTTPVRPRTRRASPMSPSAARLPGHLVVVLHDRLECVVKEPFASELAHPGQLHVPLSATMDHRHAQLARVGHRLAKLVIDGRPGER